MRNCFTGMRAMISSANLARYIALLLAIGGLCLAPAAGQQNRSKKGWRIYVTNDTCPDVTWGFTEAQTRKAFADLIRSHLDQMNRSDGDAPEDRDHYNMAAAYELFSFLEHYPQRGQELAKRIREGRVYVSPFLCNSLWGWQSAEGVLRTLYPARRLERDFALDLSVAEHIELPSLPWGMAPLLAGSGIRWVSVPFLDYDCTFKGLRNPPLFHFEGPDGSRLGVILDSFASLRANYSQGAELLKHLQKILSEWIPHYELLGFAYPATSLLASGTHSDISPSSWQETAGFYNSIKEYNAAAGDNPRILNSTLAGYCRTMDAVESQHRFMPLLRGCFGHSWELWPVSLARIAADARIGEQFFLAAETLVALAGMQDPQIYRRTRPLRERAEWDWAMLSDHAWNGTDEANRRHNAGLRRGWAAELAQISREISGNAWKGLGLTRTSRKLTVFNPTSINGDYLLSVSVPAGMKGLKRDGAPVPTQIVDEDGESRLYFVGHHLPGFSFREYEWTESAARGRSRFQFSNGVLEGPFYRLTVDSRTGGISSLIHKPSGRELLAGSASRKLAQTLYFDGQEHLLAGVDVRLASQGPVLARIEVIGMAGGVRATTGITLFAGLDRVDLDVRVDKPARDKQERLCQFFPFGPINGDWRIETPGAVVRPRPQPEGDLLPGADSRRFAVQGFIDYSPPGRPGVTVVPLETFALRLDLDSPAFEALGNDQNYKEVSRDQDGDQHFRFRYSLRAHTPGPDVPGAVTWSRQVRAAIQWESGALPLKWIHGPRIQIDQARAVVTCLKPVDDPDDAGLALRVWELQGRSGPLEIACPGCVKARRTDLLERHLEELPVRSGTISVPIRSYGFTAVRLDHR